MPDKIFLDIPDTSFTTEDNYLSRSEILTLEQARAQVFGGQRVFENQSINWNINTPSAAGAVNTLKNWGVGPDGLNVRELDVFNSSGENVVIGIVDTGFDYSHSIFSGLRDREGLLDFESFDHEGKPISEIGTGPDLRSRTGKIPTSLGWHGTHVTGVLVGDDIGDDFFGLSSKSDIVAVQVSNSVLSFKSGFDFLLDKNCDVISLSLGQPGLQEAWGSSMLALASTGAAIFAAAGNEYIYEGQRNRSPANYPMTEIIAVGAHDRSGNVWHLSGGGDMTWPAEVPNAFGQDIPSIFPQTDSYVVPDIVAPGVDIVSSAPQETNYSATGTSMATPHVSGLTARILSILRASQPGAEPKHAVDILLNSTSDMGAPGKDVRYGSGQIDIEKVVENISHFINN